MSYFAAQGKYGISKTQERRKGGRKDTREFMKDTRKEGRKADGNEDEDRKTDNGRYKEGLRKTFHTFPDCIETLFSQHLKKN